LTAGLKKTQLNYIYSVSVVLHLTTVCWVFGGIIWKWKGKLCHSAHSTELFMRTLRTVSTRNVTPQKRALYGKLVDFSVHVNSLHRTEPLRINLRTAI
jgi:hypothetical protein